MFQAYKFKTDVMCLCYLVIRYDRSHTAMDLFISDTNEIFAVIYPFTYVYDKSVCHSRGIEWAYEICLVATPN